MISISLDIQKEYYCLWNQMQPIIIIWKTQYFFPTIQIIILGVERRCGSLPASSITLQQLTDTQAHEVLSTVVVFISWYSWTNISFSTNALLFLKMSRSNHFIFFLINTRAQDVEMFFVINIRRCILFYNWQPKLWFFFPASIVNVIFTRDWIQKVGFHIAYTLLFIIYIEYLSICLLFDENTLRYYKVSFAGECTLYNPVSKIFWEREIEIEVSCIDRENIKFNIWIQSIYECLWLWCGVKTAHTQLFSYIQHKFTSDSMRIAN